ncbi:MAG: ABC transporter ATP-binding protein [Candidatus Sumerlaeota bacterium]|nr:ABC transporter ATP-binding protein [Candidatus Sumerlaeota bacterium]
MADVLIHLEDLWKTYEVGQEQVHALRGVTLEVCRNEYVAIIGPSGSGKSTLMNLIGCLDSATEGQYILNGRYTSALSEDESKERIARARGAIEAVGLGDRRRHRPNELSGGQRQRVAIARALVTNPSLLLADEPTGNLDTATGKDILALFDRLHQSGNTILLVTHNPEVAHHAHRVVTILDGCIESDVHNSR